MERSDMDGRVAIARRRQPDGWIKSTDYRPELQIHTPQSGIFSNLKIFPFRQRFLATSLTFGGIYFWTRIKRVGLVMIFAEDAVERPLVFL